MKKGMLLICYLLFASYCLAQSNAFVISKEYPNGFIEFYNKKGKKTAKNINYFLQFSLFQNLLENDTSMNTEAPTWRTTIHINNPRMLSLTNSTTNGTETTNNHFVFNAATGAAIDIQEMINANGMALIKRSMAKEMKQRASNTNFDITGKEKCIKEDVHQFLVTKDSLIIFPESCLTQTSDAQAHTLNKPIRFSSEQMSRYLSPYGQALFGLSKKPKLKKMYTHAVMGLYAGKHDQEPILIQLNAPFEKALTGTLYYLNSKKAIPLSGSFKNNRFEVESTIGKLILVVSSGQINGYKKMGNKNVGNLKLIKQ